MMKIFFTVALMAFSLSSFAFWNEIECDAVVDRKTIRVEVEQSFPTGSYFKRAMITITENGAQEIHDFNVTSRRWGMNQIQYSGAGLRLEVDFWPDQAPRWGRDYRGQLRTNFIGNNSMTNVQCTFPNAY
jgi:hypothetical protein